MEKNTNTPRLIDANQMHSISSAAKHLKLSRNSIYEYMKNEELDKGPAHKRLKGVPYNGGLAVLVPEKED